MLLALGGAAAPLTGCDLFDRADEPEPPPDPLRPMVDESLGLAAAYRASALAHPDLADRLNPIADTHTAHATELARIVGVTLGSAPAVDPSATAASAPAAALAALRAREKAAQQSATAACAAAPAERAALLGSIVAARATHQEALK